MNVRGVLMHGSNDHLSRSLIAFSEVQGASNLLIRFSASHQLTPRVSKLDFQPLNQNIIVALEWCNDVAYPGG